ncbi:MAG: dTDP-4-dehydrorhamnose reductase [bacterium]
MKILVIGAKGMLGQDLCPILKKENEVIEADINEIDIVKIDQVNKFIKQTNSDLIINLAAYTDVDGCEINKDKAFEINSLGTWNIALIASELNKSLVYISTDYVFNGQKESPYLEFDFPNPINTYGWSKLAGEEYVKTLVKKFYIIRTSWLFGKYGKNFINTIIKLSKEQNEIKVVDDQNGSPTFTVDLSYQISKLIKTNFFGTYHISNKESCTWFEFAKKIIEISGSKTKILPIASSEIKRLAKRPTNSVLKNYCLELRKMDLSRSWEDAIKEYLSL